MVMTVLMHDAKQALNVNPAYAAHSEAVVEELLYADDTLLIHSDAEVVRVYMDCVKQAGQNYGLAFNWKKLENMPVRCVADFFSPNGQEIQRKGSFKYLGSMLCNSGKPGTELSCRLGAARKEFDSLCRVWSHASLPRDKKLRVYEACVVTKLMYCLDTIWLNKAEIGKLEAFHHRCLRRVAGIQPSYISRVSNEAVRSALHTQPLKNKLLERQLIYLGSVASRPAGNVLRDFVFNPGNITLRAAHGPRRKGRPRAAWAKKLHAISMQIAGNEASLASMWEGTTASKHAWERAVHAHCKIL